MLMMSFSMVSMMRYSSWDGLLMKLFLQEMILNWFKTLIANLNQHFALKDLRSVTCFLGTEVSREDNSPIFEFVIYVPKILSPSSNHWASQVGFQMIGEVPMVTIPLLVSILSPGLFQIDGCFSIHSCITVLLVNHVVSSGTDGINNKGPALS